MTRSLLIALAAALALQAGPAGAQDRALRIATEGAYPPWNQTGPSGELTGFEVDLANDLCARMEVECEIVAQSWEGIIPALQDGKYDAIMAAMSITDERRQVIQFSDPYADSPSAFVAPADGDLAAAGLAGGRLDLDEVGPEEEATIEALQSALEGKTIGVQVGTTHQNFLETYLEDADVRRYDTQENLDLDLQAGRIDAALADQAYWEPMLEGEQGQGLAIVSPSMAGGPYGEGIGVGIRQGEDELVQKFNEAIAAAREDGTIRELSEKWFGFDASA
ncbi:MAG TPA: lysine/arginine/ornithine ABC transporter substrate-binding protein [Geminicoccaceae bacterium]